MYQDLREWLGEVEALGELRVVEGAHWDLEIGMAAALAVSHPNGPAVLFDRIAGYPPGYRVLANSMESLNRFALTANLPLHLDQRELVNAWREKARHLKPLPPIFLSTGPVFEHTVYGEAVDLFAFPAPRWRETDGGRYLGTGALTITRDPDDGWINLGNYRNMVLTKNRLGFYICPSKHGRIHREKYYRRGEACPVAVCCGQDPLLHMVASKEIPYGVSEYDICGGIKGEPIRVVPSKLYDLPIPADAELVLEGISRPGETMKEGPFGEWHGYSATGIRDEPFIEVQAIYHRQDPMILAGKFGDPRGGGALLHQTVFRSAMVQDQMEKAGVPDVRGVWVHPAGGVKLLTIVAIHQRYPGHARQAGLVACQCAAGFHMGRYVIVLDDDIDITDLQQVMWAVCTRSDPARSIEILHRLSSTPLDPAIRTADADAAYNSQAIIDACRPYEWGSSFAPLVEMSQGLKAEVLRKWGALLRP